VPAAAVIPAPIVYISVVAVKTLVVGFRAGLRSPPKGVFTPWMGLGLPKRRCCALLCGAVILIREIYFE